MASEPQTDWASVGTGSSLAPLDAALDYLRERGSRVLPVYLVAVAPLSAAMLFAIDVVTSEHRAALPFACLLVSLAMVWRWAWVAAAQRRVQADLRGEAPLPLGGRLPKILLTKLVLSLVVLWGVVLVVPAFYGFFLSGIAVPILLEGEGYALPQIRKAFGWVHDAAPRLARVSGALAMGVLLGVLAIVVLHLFVLGTVLPSLLGLDAADLWVTVASGPWTLCVAYLVFVVFDLYWTVASVMVFYDLQSRRLGTDLRVRLRRLREGGP